MIKLDNLLQEPIYHKDKAGNIVKSNYFMRKSLERTLCIGGIVLALGGLGDGYYRTSKHQEKKEIALIENLADHEEGKITLRQKMLNDRKIKNKKNDRGAFEMLLGIAGLFTTLVGFSYRSQRCEFEEKGYVISD